MSPDERALRHDLTTGAYRAGEAAGQWRLINIGWPYATFAVTAAQRGASPDEWIIRWECAGYPNIAPTGGVWDLNSDTSLAPDRRPKGERAAQLFRSDGWLGGGMAMYAAWDRLGLQAHADWASKYPMQAWTPTRDVTFILTQVHEVLNADDYLGA